MAFVPEVNILLLGDPECGRSTFLKQLPKGQYGGYDGPDPQHEQDPGAPLSFDVSLYNRPYTFKIYTNGSSSYLPTRVPDPDFCILCYDISSRSSLHNARHHWCKLVALNFYDPADSTPVMLLGLKRDLREDGEDTIYPDEGYRTAQEMRCDRYAECSAATGELMWEVLEDITKTAAKTTTEGGGQSSGPMCLVM